MANAAPEGRQRGEDGGMTIRKPRLGQVKNVAESSAPPIPLLPLASPLAGWVLDLEPMGRTARAFDFDWSICVSLGIRSGRSRR